MSNYSSNFPTQRPSLNLVFNGGSDQLDSRISFSRADTPPTYAAPSAVHYWSNEKHKSSENLVTQSNGSDWIFDSADYTKTANQNGPDNSTNATKFTEKANGSEQYQIRSNNFTPIANQEITYSVWLKQTSGSRNYQQVRVGNIGANQAFATFNLTNGTVDQTGGTLGVSASVNAGPTGWYQCVMKFTPTSTTAILFYIYAAAASGGEIPNVTGDTGNSFTMFGAQASTTGETVVNETSGQIHRSYSSTLKSVANAGAPRFEYDPTDGQSVGLLIEAQSSNLFARSAGFDYTAAWTKTNVTATAEAISPDGTLNAFAIRESASGGTKRIHQAATVAAGSVAVSVYAKLLGNERRLVIREDSTTGDSAVFDLSSGTVAATNVGGTGTIESVGNGWYRCTLLTSPSGSPGYSFGFWLATATGTNYESYTGDGYSGVLLFGAMCENASAPSSYVESLASTTTRAADSCSVAVSGFDLTSSQDVTILVEGDYGDPSVYSNNRFAVALGKDSQSYIGLYNGAGESGSGYIRTNGPTEFYNASGVTSGNFKAAISAKNNSVKYAANGTSFPEDTDAELPQYTELKVGGQFVSDRQIGGTISRVAVYGQALSSTELAALTS